MKKRLAALLCALVLLTASALPAAALEGETLRTADTLRTLGLINGTASGGYALNDPATRGQAAVLLVRLAGGESAAAKDPWLAGFRDLDTWCADAVNYAAHQGWVQGVSVLDFRPSAAVTADEWCTWLLRMLGYRDSDGDFAAGEAALFAQHIGLTDRLWSGELTRGDLFEILLDALTFSFRDGSGTVLEKLVDAGVCSRSAANALGLMTPELSARQISDRLSAAVFCISGYERLLDLEADQPTYFASGFFISADGLAVTNYHSIQGSLYATVTLSTGEVYPVESVVWYDAAMDLAVLRISRTSRDGKSASAFACLEMVGTEDLRAGDRVYALGNPLGLGLSVSEGVVSAVAREADGYALPCVVSTADISQGSSGGALFNAYGQVVGVTSGAFALGNDMYLAVPTTPLLELDLSGQGISLLDLAKQAA